MKFERQWMVNWYHTGQLASTAIKAIISGIFGNFADKREIEAVLSKAESFDYSGKDDIWVDYISDLGDGFNSTYTMAHLIAKENLEIPDKSLKRGEILVMGGDQVYPTPEITEYQNRFQGPYEAALPLNKDKSLPHPHLYALPGNHDWYDGLGSFIKLFCQKRSIGNWLTQQARSYFVLKLPHNHWIWGIDIQLNADIDKPQLDYFEKIATEEMNAGDKVILCTAEPAWVYHYTKKNDLSYDRLKFFENKYICEKKLQLIATFTGDLHHYSRFVIKDENGNEKSHLITAGGGGAFMHPTHFLKSRNEEKGLPFSELKATYPSQSTSKKFAFCNLAFPIWNWSLALTLGIFFLITAWFLQSTTKHEGGSFMEDIANYEISLRNIGPVLILIWHALSHNPAVVLLNLLLLAGLISFTDTHYGKGRWNLIAGVLHGVIQLANFYFLLWLFSVINLSPRYLHLGIDNADQIFAFASEMIIMGGILSGLIFGIYLIVSTLVFKSHPTEAYSSLRSTRYKNFIRMHISRDGIEIYPIGVKQAVKNWVNTGTEEMPKFEGDEIKYELIEPPIIIK